MLIENSVTRITVWHHERCRTVTPSDGIFNLHQRTIMDFFFFHTVSSTIAFRLEYVLFYQFNAKITTFFDQEKFGTAPLLYVDVETFGGNWHKKWRQDVKNAAKTSKPSSWRHERESSHPSCETTFPSPGRVHGKPDRVCKKYSSRIPDKVFCDFHQCWQILSYIYPYPTRGLDKKRILTRVANTLVV